MNRLVCLFVLGSLTACGGGGGSGGNVDGSGSTVTYSLSGFVTSAVTGVAVQGTVITLSGSGSASTTTDGSGNYRFSGLANGTYTVTASQVDAFFAPDSMAVTINGASVANRDFFAIRGAVVGSGIEFLPQTFLSNEQLRVSLQLADGYLLYSDSSDTPLKKQPLDGSPAVALADRFESAENVTLYNGSLYWIDGGDLHRKLADGRTVVLADGERATDADVTADIVVDDSHVYWVDQAPVQNCSPPCNWVIEKVPLDGGPVVELGTADRRIDSLAGDAGNLYWEESSLEPWAADCDCGSKIYTVAKAGGAAVLLVDGSLNNGLPPLPPGYTPASWYPTGGIALSDNDVVFAVSGNSMYELKSIPKSGGVITHLATVATTASFARNAVLDMAVSGSSLLWLDTGNASLSSLSLSGGLVSSLVGGLQNPGGLTVTAGKAYWTEAGAYVGCCLAMGAGSVREIFLDSRAAGVVIANLDKPVAISADETNLVWSEFWRIGVAPVTGGNAATLVSGIASNLARFSVSQSTVYVLDGALIKSVPVAGGTVEKLAAANAGAIDDFSTRSGDITTDSDRVYWTTLDVIAAPVVASVSTAGGNPVILGNQGNIPNPQDCSWRIAVDQQNVYWSEGSTIHPVGCAVRKVPISGGAVTTLLDEPYVADFTVDGVDVYFSEFLDGSIRKLPVDGGASALVAANVFAWILANDANNLYWLDLQQGWLAGMEKTAGPADYLELPLEILMDPFLAFEALLPDDSGLYFSESQTGSIYRIY